MKSYFSTCQQDQCSSPTFALPPGNRSSSALNDLLHVAKEEKSHRFPPPKPAQQQTTVTPPHCNLGHFCQPHAKHRCGPHRQGKGEQQLPMSALRIPTSWGGPHSGTKSYEKYE